MSFEYRVAIENGHIRAMLALQTEIDNLAKLESQPCDLQDYVVVVARIKEAKKEQSDLKTAIAEHKYKWACRDMKDAIKELGDLCQELPNEERHARVVNRVMSAQEEQRVLIVQMYGLRA